MRASSRSDVSTSSRSSETAGRVTPHLPFGSDICVRLPIRETQEPRLLLSHRKPPGRYLVCACQRRPRLAGARDAL
jgi:hypothetical protein